MQEKFKREFRECAHCKLCRIVFFRKSAASRSHFTEDNSPTSFNRGTMTRTVRANATTEMTSLSRQCVHQVQHKSTGTSASGQRRNLRPSFSSPADPSVNEVKGCKLQNGGDMSAEQESTLSRIRTVHEMSTALT